MKRTFSLLMISAMLLTPSIGMAAAPRNTLGRILLQVESHGEAWYVSPVSGHRTYLKDGNTAYALLRADGLGIKSSDLSGIPIGIETSDQEADADGDGLSDSLERAIGTDPGESDTDQDGYSDGIEVQNNFNALHAGGTKNRTDSAVVRRLSGRILLQVESHGEAWYINPADGKRYYLKDGNAAYNVMRHLSLGVSNTNLSAIPQTTGAQSDASSNATVGSTASSTKLTVKDCGTDMGCLRAAVIASSPATVKMATIFPILFSPIVIVGTGQLTFTQGEGDWNFTSKTISVERLAEKDRAAFVPSPLSNEEFNGILASSTREQILAAGYSAEEADTFLSQDYLDSRVSKTEVSCTQVDRTELVATLDRWSKYQFSGSSEDADGFIGGDYTFGRCK